MHVEAGRNNSKQHILDIDFYNSPIDIDYIIAIKHNIKTILNSVDVSILYNDLYDNHFELNSKSLEDRLIGPVLYRSQESIDSCTSYNNLVELYLMRDIKKFFGYTLDEFLNLSRYARINIVEQAEKHMERLAEQMEALQQNQAFNQRAGADDELTNILMGDE